MEHCLLVGAGSCRRGVSLEGGLKFRDRLKQSILVCVCLIYYFQLHVLNEKFKNKRVDSCLIFIGHFCWVEDWEQPFSKWFSEFGKDLILAHPITLRLPSATRHKLIFSPSKLNKFHLASETEFTGDPDPDARSFKMFLCPLPPYFGQKCPPKSA